MSPTRVNTNRVSVGRPVAGAGMVETPSAALSTTASTSAMFLRVSVAGFSLRMTRSLPSMRWVTLKCTSGRLAGTLTS
jgi:hypothetical protein